MVDPRIYRALLLVVVFAVIVFGFSLQDQPGALGTTAPPGQFFTSTYTAMKTLARQYPNRAPGSVGDQRLAARVAGELSGDGFTVQTQAFEGQTSAGQRLLETVSATRVGVSPGTVVVLSNRDATRTGAVAQMSGTAVLEDLGRALSGATLSRSVMLVSTSGQIGLAGATELANSLTGHPVDAVIVLGDLASAQLHSPSVVAWSDGDSLAPPALRNTLARFVAGQAPIGSQNSGVAGQVARLAFPFAVTGQAPFARRGIPAVLLSVSGDRQVTGPQALAPPSRISALGTAVLQSVEALDTGPPIAAPSSYLVLSGKLVPLWALRLLVLALILPVAATTLDAMARTRRRGHVLSRWVGWVLAGAVPFLVGLAAVILARAAGLFSSTPPGAVAGGVPLTGGDLAVLAFTLVLVIASFVFLRPLCLRLLSDHVGSGRLARHLGRAQSALEPPSSTRRPESPPADAAAVALSVVMCVLAVIVWLENPYSALLLVPALHLWLWLSQPGARSRRWSVVALLLIGVVPGVLLLLYYAIAYHLSPLGLAWSLALMPGGPLPIVVAVCWSVALGCLVSAIVIAWRGVQAVVITPEAVVSVRGPASYAGPGSLGGTKSALRR